MPKDNEPLQNASFADISNLQEQIKNLHEQLAIRNNPVKVESMSHFVGGLPEARHLEGNKNYADWKFWMKNFLVDAGLWSCVVQPSTIDNTTDLRCLAKINLSVKSNVASIIKKCTTAKEAWMSLENHFENKGTIRLVSLYSKLFHMNFNLFNTMQEYIDSVMSVAEDLENIGEPLRDTAVGAIMLAGLPESYDPLILGIQGSNQKTTSDFVKNLLLQENLKGLDKSSEKGYVLRSQETYEKSAIQCYRCKKFGHKSNKCHANTLSKSKQNAFIARCNIVDATNDKWYFDSGASIHITKNPQCLFDVSSNEDNFVGVANGEHLKCEKKGKVEFFTSQGRQVITSDVSYVPGIELNLLSIHQITKKGNYVVFNENKCYVLDEKPRFRKDNVIATGKQSSGLYCLELNYNNNDSCANLVNKTNGFELWHKRLAHLNVQSLKALENGVVTGVSLQGEPPEDCEVCAKSKQCRAPFHKSEPGRAVSLLDVIHTDVCGPMRTSSLGGAFYFVTYTDDFSRKSMVYFIKNKYEVFDTFMEYKALVENQTGKTIKTLRSDNGTEYVNNKFKNYLLQCGIMLNTSAPYTPEQNGLAERLNRTLLEKARSMLFQSGLKVDFWAEAIATAVYLKNVSPTKVLKDKTPQEVWSGKKPNLKHLKVFGCKAMVHIPKKKRSKWDPQSEVHIFLGYCETEKNYRAINLDSLSITTTRDISFYENVFPAMDVDNKESRNSDFMTSQIEERYHLTICDDAVEDIPHDSQENIQPVEDIPHDIIPLEMDPNGTNNVIEEDIESVEDVQEDENFISAENSIDSSNDSFDEECQSRGNTDNRFAISSEISNEILRRSIRVKQPNKQIYNDNFVAQVTAHKSGDPLSYKIAMERDDSDMWQRAINDEISCHLKNKTFEICDSPKDKKPIKSKWVFKTKYNADGSLDKYKARLVAKGYSQQEGIDYDEVFAPVVRHSSIRLLLALAIEQNLDIDQMDVVTAFLHPKLEEEIYMQLPNDDRFHGQCCKLLKSIYGLKQASHVWNSELDKVLKKLDFHQSKYDPCVYIRRKSKSIIYISVYVDDLLIFSNNNEEKILLKSSLSKIFQMKDLGPASYILGYRIQYNKEEKYLTVDQTKYIQDLLHRFNMSDCNGVRTPMDPNQVFTKPCPSDSETRVDVNIPYQEAIGSLLYVSQGTRPDINFAVNYLSRFNNNYNQSHWNAVKRIMRYLKATIDTKLTFTKKNNNTLFGYSDADWAGDISDRKSTTGYVFCLSNGPISWSSKKQPTIALSTTEAEYMAMSSAVQEALWLTGLLSELYIVNYPITIFGDNKGAIDLSRNAKYQARTKHIDVRHHFVRDYVQKNVIKIDQVSTKEMVADMLTKSLPYDGHSFCSKFLLNMS